MNDFKSLLNSLNLQDETEAVQVPFAPQASMPDSLADAAQAEAVEQAPVRIPAAAPAPVEPKMADLASNLKDSYGPDSSSSSLSQIKTKISGTIPSSDTANGSETAEARLERLMRDLNEQRNKEREDAASRKFKADIFKILGDSAGGIIGGAQAMNTKAAVAPIQTKGYDVGDLVGEVDKRFAGDRQALLDQYQQLLNARDRADQRKFQQESLNVQREGNRIKEKALDNKPTKLTVGQEAADRAFGKEYTNWTTSGQSKTDANLKKLNEALAQLESGEFDSSGRVQGRLPDILQSEEAINMREMIRGTAQETLRQTLGAQFTENEGRAIMERAYDPKLSPQANAKRVRAVVEELTQARDERNRQVKEFEQKGSLSQYQSSPSQISTDKNTISNVDAKIDAFMKKNSISDRNEAIKILKDNGKI